MTNPIRVTLSKLNAARKRITIERVARIYGMACVGVYAMLVMADPASAQSLRATGETIFNTLYGLIGVCGGISAVVAAINWKMGNFLGARDPKQTFMHTLIGTGAAFGSVGLIQFVKSAVGTSTGISGV